MTLVKLSALNKKVNIADLGLEEAILDYGIMMHFLSWLHGQLCSENLTFWLEAQVYKYCNQEELKEESKRILDLYFDLDAMESDLNIDDPAVYNELKRRSLVPDRTLFMSVQNAIWSLLRLESFPKFKYDVGKKLAKKPSKVVKVLKKSDSRTIELYHKFFELTKTSFEDLNTFNPTILPFDHYDEHLHQNLPTVDELWKDRDLMVAFREFLYSKNAEENLSFYIATMKFKHCDSDDLEETAKEIYESYIDEKTSKQPVNVDHSLKIAIKKALKNPSRTVFDRLIAKIYKVIKNEWFPEFIVSPYYQECNNDTLELVHTKGKERSNTLTYYDLYVKFLRKGEKKRKVSARKPVSS